MMTELKFKYKCKEAKLKWTKTQRNPQKYFLKKKSSLKRQMFNVSYIDRTDRKNDRQNKNDNIRTNNS